MRRVVLVAGKFRHLLISLKGLEGYFFQFFSFYYFIEHFLNYVVFLLFSIIGSSFLESSADLGAGTLPTRLFPSRVAENCMFGHAYLVAVSTKIRVIPGVLGRADSERIMSY